MRPDEIRDQLFAALARNDDATFIDLCNRFRANILEDFSEFYCTVPEALRTDRKAAETWMNSILTIAQVFETVGHPELMERLTGGSESPINRWTRTFTEASQVSQSGQYRESSRLLLEILAGMEGASGSFVDEFRPKVYGLLGTNHFHVGDSAGAQKFTALALADCQRVGDREGIRIYSENLRILSARR